MILTACIDDRGGMLFHRRRQSQDRLLRQDLLMEASGRPLWLNAYSLKQFSSPPENLRCAEDFPGRAGSGELCFFEDTDPAPWLDKAESILLYHWNRRYPADLYFPLLPPCCWPCAACWRRDAGTTSGYNRSPAFTWTASRLILGSLT